MNKTKLLTLVMALMLLLAIPTAAFAQRVPPHVFVGTASLDGTAAVDGAAVTAWIDGEQVSATNTIAGEYTLTVDQGDSSFAGSTVSFRVSGASASKTATWITGGAEILNLVAATGSGTADSGAVGESGDKGATGAKGDQGDTGQSGAAGVPGSNGTDGKAGSAGLAGVDGKIGPAGPAGAAGDSGSGGLGVIALIVAIVALVAAGGSYMMGRRA